MIKNTRRLCRTTTFLTAVFVCASACLTSTLFAQKAKISPGTSVGYTQTITVNVDDAKSLADGRVVYSVADKMPEYPGDLQAFLTANLRYPDEARRQKSEGRSVVRFIVSSDGKISDAEIIRSSGDKLLDDESLRVVSLMPAWTPGVRDGNPVAVFFNLPVSFKLD